MSYKINPCKAVIEKVEDSNCDINTMNDLCYGVARAYGGAYGPDLQKKLEAQCADNGFCTKITLKFIIL